LNVYRTNWLRRRNFDHRLIFPTSLEDVEIALYPRSFLGNGSDVHLWRWTLVDVWDLDEIAVNHSGEFDRVFALARDFFYEMAV
jgi:hypothetical protein